MYKITPLIAAEQPGQPQNMVATGFTENSITLEWEAGFWGYADTLYYKLEMSVDDSAWKPWGEVRTDFRDCFANSIWLMFEYTNFSFSGVLISIRHVLVTRLLIFGYSVRQCHPDSLISWK